MNTILSKEKSIDALVNNAGYGSYGAIEDVPLEEGRRQFEVNLFGMARLIRLVTPAMWEQHYEKIVNISSMDGKIWTKFGGWYHATKYAVEGLSDCLRMELQPFGIDVVVVEPGGIKTDRGLIAAENLKKRPEGAEKETFKEVAENRKEKAEVPEEQSLKRAAPVVKAPKQEQTVKKKMEKERSPSVSEELNEAEKVARNWYIMEGREKFHHISMKLASEGVNSFSIGKDGLCSIRTEKGFRRVAAIRDFPAQKMLVIKKELEKEGIYLSLIHI